MPADRLLAEHVDGISLIVGGHSHSLQGDFSQVRLSSSLEYGECVDGTRILQAGAHTQALGHCDLVFNDQGELIDFEGQNEILFSDDLYQELAEQVDAANLKEIYKVFENHPQLIQVKKDNDVEQLLAQRYRPKLIELREKVIIDNPQTISHSC